MPTAHHARLVPYSHTTNRHDDKATNIPQSRQQNNPIPPFPPPLIFYPAYCHKASPTWFKWVKLTAHEIHHNLTTHPHHKTLPRIIKTENGYRPTIENQLLFYLNHPIQYVQVIGIILNIEDFERFWLLTVDDSSGSTIDVKCDKPLPIKKDDDTDDEDEDSNANTNTNVKAKAQKNKYRNKNEKKPTPNSTTTTKTNQEKSTLYTLLQTLSPGITAQLKGHLLSFRSTLQLNLDRLIPILSTNKEIELIASRTQFLEEVLSKPWVLSKKEQRRLLREENGDVERERERVRRSRKREERKVQREIRHAERVAREYESEECERAKEAEEARAAGALLKKGSGKRV